MNFICAASALEAFATVTNQLLQDVQERLVFRAHLYLQSDILNYNPSAGDLAYPDKLEMMEVSKRNLAAIKRQSIIILHILEYSFIPARKPDNSSTWFRLQITSDINSFDLNYGGRKRGN